VHWVDAQYDHGQHVVQRRCPVLPGDTPETLAERVWAEETRAYPEAIRQVLGAQAPA
jgi:phosphoribosylglycinamide formyltransferase-1